MQASLKTIYVAVAFYLLVTTLIAVIWRDSTAIQTGAVVLTGLVIIWYTWETQLLRQAAVAQRELQLRPFVVLQMEAQEFVLSNLGFGTAINIRVKDALIDEGFKITAHFSPKNIAVLQPGASRAIHAESFKDGKSAGDFFLSHLKPNYANREINVTIEFHNVEMKAYFVKEHISPGQLQIDGIRSAQIGTV